LFLVACIGSATFFKAMAMKLMKAPANPPGAAKS
jgi:hypothetical protein